MIIETCVQSIDKCKRMIILYIILYANFVDNSAISLVSVDVVFFSNFS